MSLVKVMKGWRAVLKLTILRKGPRLPTGKAVPRTKETKLDSEARQHSTHQIFKTSWLRSIFSRYSGLIGRQSLSYLRPRNAGVHRMRHVPVISLLGFSLGLEVDLISDSYKENTMSAVRNIFKDYQWEPDKLESKPQSLNDLDINKISIIGNGCEGAVFEAKLKSEDVPSGRDVERKGQEYDLAIKAVFNYGAESDASSILRELRREIVPLQQPECEHNEEDDVINTNIQHLPAHPNIVDMPGIFVDDMLVTEQGRREFPAALPRRVDSEGCFGRNKTLYLVMKKCSMKLSDFLSANVSMTTRCLLLTQLLEAVHHMTMHRVAHRDLKADNILIDVPVSQGTPRLQVCDFGCCLAEKNKELVVPYTSSDINLGGNSWLMAPEIACATPGEGSVLDFRKSDLWACGALAYQILGVDNPFYPNSFKQLRSKTYNEDELPALPDNVPLPIKKLVRSLMARDPAKRPSPSVAVLVVQMVLWDANNNNNSTRLPGNQHSSSPVTAYNSSSFARRRHPHHPRVVVTKGGHYNKSSSRYLQYANKERQKLGLVLAKMLDLIRKMTETSTKPSKQDVRDISNFLCLSRLTQSDFAMALKFFH